MKKKLRKLILLCSLLFNPSIWASDDCPNSQKDVLELKTQLENFKLIHEGLKEFLNGKVLQGKSLSTLFIVNLEDGVQIAQRQKDLDSFLKKEHPKINCKTSEATKLIHERSEIEFEIAKARLNFLSLPENQRLALIALQREAIRNQSEIESLRKVGEKAEEKIEQTEEAIKSAESLSLSSSSADLRELAAEIAVIERFRKSVAEKVSELTSKMESLGDEYQLQTKKLGEISSVLSQSDATMVDIHRAYENVALKWRMIVDDVVKTDHFTQGTELKLPKERDDILRRASNSGLKTEIEKYNESLSKAKIELNSLKDLSLKFSSLKREQRYRELVITGQIRSQLIRMIEDRGDKTPFRISNNYIDDVIREIKLVPYRPKALFVSALNKVKETSSSGVEGILELVENVLVLSLFILIPIFSVFLLRKILTSIEEGRRKVLRGRNRAQPTKWLNWLLWARPYLPWMIMLVAMNVSKSVVEGTELNWLSEVLPYFNFYFVYKLFRVFIDNNLFAINQISQNKLTRDLQYRIEKTSQYLGVFFLLSAYLLETTATVARRALFYRLIWDMLILATPIVLALSAFSWRVEIASALRQTLSPHIFEKFSRLLVGPLAILFSLPAAIFLTFLTLFQRLKEELLEVDSIKSISAQLFRKKIESNLDEDLEVIRKDVDDKYKSQFSPLPLTSREYFIEASSPLSSIEDVIAKWIEGSSDERSIALYGEKGVGKSTILNLIKADCEIIRTSIPKKITNGSDLVGFLNDHCSLNLDSLDEMPDKLYSIDSDLKSKRVIIIDNTQNLFLSHRKGFDAFRDFASLVTLKTKNIFWCASFNYYSWVYLNAISNGSQFFRRVIKINSWGDEEIRELILSRHKLSGYDLEFNPVIYSLGSRSNHETFQYIQDRFFELLWEQSKGNPRTALALWLSSLTPSGKNKLRVGLPGGHLPQKIEGLNEEELFVIASIARHENLNTKCATLVTGLDENIVQHAVRIGVERGFLTRADDGTYRITPIWQPVVIRELVGKNLIYG